ncbi:MAG: zinc-binding dehydrogenase, partial [Clostridia bacterium]|nr:zinc-binding dehydrogenase [Clostridia bacterium]
MKNRQIVFTAPGKAELLEYDIPDELKPGEVRVKTKYTAISSGTERANLVGEVNISGVRRLCNGNFPRKVGYCGVGTVVETGSAVREVRPGQRVIIYFGKHCEYNVIPEEKAVPITPESLTDEEAALMVIGCFPENAIRKTRLELGESVSVVGLGILGILAVQFARAAGATPVIGVDLNPDCREKARKYGADFVVDPLEGDYEARMKELTGGKGVDVTIEATGSYKALNSALRCCAPMGRVALLGCTRTPDVIALRYYTRKLAETDRAIDVNIAGQKTPKMVICDERQRMTFENLIQQYTGNLPFIFGAKSLQELGNIQVLDTSAPFVASDLAVIKRQQFAEALTYFGISNSSSEKKE